MLRPLTSALLLATLALAACGGDDGAGDGSTLASRTVRIDATEYRFDTAAPPAIVVGETIEFDVRNVGRLVHEMQVLDEVGRLLDRTGRIMPGSADTVTVTFDEAGSYQIICDVDDHLSRGQRAVFEVTPG
ncbi:MAG: cupredoxin domain-containing protein [Ilumatobacteraceae bacterium]|nr:cupredoxin domain-containing protein [Ilumatobacteraceae bacterium]